MRARPRCPHRGERLARWAATRSQPGDIEADIEADLDVVTDSVGRVGLARRVALVTGGAGAIGAAICRALSSAGATVVVADRDSERAGMVAGEVGGSQVAMDVADPISVDSAVREVRARIGAPTIVVNCAGFDLLKPFLDTDEQFTMDVLQVNLHGPIRVLRATLGGMVSEGWGRVVNIGSDAGRVGSSLEVVYSAAKGGLIALSKALAREHASHGITVNTVCPGPTDTPLLASAVKGAEAGERAIQAIVRSVPIKRLGLPDDVAPAVAFLVSDQAAFITGQTLSVSGGLTMV